MLVLCLTMSLVLVLGLTTGLEDPTPDLLNPEGVFIDPGIPMGFTFSFRILKVSF